MSNSTVASLCATSTSASIARARGALTCAGLALRGTRHDEKDPELAAPLLVEALTLAASAISSEQVPVDVIHAVQALDDAVLKATVGGRKQALRLVQAMSQLRTASVDDLERAELFVAKLVEYATGGHAIRCAERRVSLALFLVIGTIVGALIFPVARRWTTSDGLQFRVSSAYDGFPMIGKLGEHHAYDLMSHPGAPTQGRVARG